MIKHICLLLALSAPLYAYTYANYFNFKSGSSNGNTYRIATVDADGTNFKVFLEVSLSNPGTSCALVSFGALTPGGFDETNVLGLTLSQSGSVVQIKDYIGGGGSYVIRKVSDSQDWRFVSSLILDPSYSYNSNTWKVEVQRPYSKVDSGRSYNVKRPADGGLQSVAFALFNGACPNGAFNFPSNPTLWTWYPNDLRPTRSNYSAIAIIGWMSTILLFALFY